MKTVKEFYLQIPETGKLIVKATCKADALQIYQAMGSLRRGPIIFFYSSRLCGKTGQRPQRLVGGRKCGQRRLKEWAILKRRRVDMRFKMKKVTPWHFEIIREKEVVARILGTPENICIWYVMITRKKMMPGESRDPEQAFHDFVASYSGKLEG